MMSEDFCTWRVLLEIERNNRKDNTPIVGNTLSEAELDIVFCAGSGGCYGEPFTVWSEKRVYFPVYCDGAEWVGSVPRDPCDECTDHQGG